MCPAPHEIIDSDECAELLRCTPEQIEELARAGEVPGLKIGRGWLFLRADLLAFLAEKARADAQERRTKRLAGPGPALPKQLRRPPPPVLPTVPSLTDVGSPAPTKLKTAVAPERLCVTAAEAARMLSIGQSTFWREVKEGTLPKPIKAGASTRWRVADLRQAVDRDPAAASSPGEGVRMDLVR